MAADFPAGSVALRLARIFRSPQARPSGAVDQIFLHLLGDFEGDRRRAVEQFLEGVRSDQGLVAQISGRAPGTKTNGGEGAIRKNSERVSGARSTMRSMRPS